MASVPFTLQGFIHALEQGRLAQVLRWVLVLVAIVGLGAAYLLIEFRGLSTSVGMRQAQIAREIARGNGFSTKEITPAAAELLRQYRGQFPIGNIPELTEAPLNPIVEAGLMHLLPQVLATPSSLSQPVAGGDLLVAGTGMVFFLAGLILLYLLATWLFDGRVAWITLLIVAVADAFWQFALAGLPQLLLLSLFVCLLLCLTRAIRAQVNNRFAHGWLFCVGIFAGLMALAHPLTFFLSGGVLLFCALYFRPRVLSAFLPLVVTAGLFGTWVYRDYQVSGTPFGLSPYSCLGDIFQSAHTWLRSSHPDLSILAAGPFVSRAVTNFRAQIGNVGSLAGGILIAPFFFTALFHRFRNPVADHLKWALVCLWAGAVASAVTVGVGPDQWSPNQLQLLLGPSFTVYAVAMILVFWHRIGLESVLLRSLLFGTLWLLTGMPTLLGFLGTHNLPRIQYPPYLPALMTAFGETMKPEAVLATDMPWAIAWYGDRRALDLPRRRQEFYDYLDYGWLGPIVGLYLTPVSRDQPFLTAITTGEYSEWSSLIMAGKDATSDFPFQSVLGIANNQCLLYIDPTRWNPNAPLK
jgi:hypothetical protein